MSSIRRAVTIMGMLVRDNANEVTKALNDKCVPDAVNFMHMIYTEHVKYLAKTVKCKMLNRDSPCEILNSQC